MNNWTATNELRFVMREEFHGLIKVLQQKWELNDPKFVYQSEWRDVPVAEEE